MSFRVLLLFTRSNFFHDKRSTFSLILGKDVVESYLPVSSTTSLFFKYVLPLFYLFSGSKVYIIPELGTREISDCTRARIEYISRVEKQKVRQVLQGEIPNMQSLVKLNPDSLGDGFDPDDPTLIENTDAARTVLIPSAPVALSKLLPDEPLQTEVQSFQNLQPLNTGEMQSLIPVQVASVKCAECGTDAASPYQCGVCGVILCSQNHLEIHSASHQVLFQCSVCGLHYGSHSECLAHVASDHSSHLFAVQNSATSYVIPGQSHSQSGAPLTSSQLSMPFIHSQPTPQCLLQISGAVQLPFVVTPVANSVTSQPVTPANCVLQCSEGVSGTSSVGPLIVQAATDPVSNVGNHTVYAMTNMFTNQDHSVPENPLQKNTNFRESFCPVITPSSTHETVSLHSTNYSSSLCTKSGLPVVLSGKISDSIPSIIVRNSETHKEQDKNTSVLMVSPSVPNASKSTRVVQSNLKSNVNVSHQASASLANVLLTLSEPPNQEQPSIYIENDMPPSHPERDMSPLVSDVHFKPNEKDAVTSADHSDMLMSISEIAEQSKEEQASTSSPEELEVTESSDVKTLQEISVEIIQPLAISVKSDSRKEKLSSKKFVNRLRKKKPLGLGNSEDLKCKTCKKLFSSSAQLEKHLAVHGIRRFKCHVCDKSFSEKYNLKIHTLTHTQERPHECTVCSQSFRYSRDLTEHKRTHDGSRPYVCDVCQKSFVRQRELVRHKREQHEMERYQCKVCGQYFKRLLYLKKIHMRIHHPLLIEAVDEEVIQESKTSEVQNKQSHICKICGRSFARARYLTSHLRVHMKRKEYVQCPTCPRMFTSVQTLKIHRQAFHNLEAHPQTNNDTGIDIKQVITQDEELVTQLDQSQTNSLVIAEVHEMSNSSPASLTSTPQASTSHFPPHSSKQLIPPLINVATEVLPYSNVTGNCDLIMEESAKSEHFSVSMDNVDPVSYLSSSFSS
ncbi:hypothetical protein SK128_022744 [Halocaridina rubra]|uniref:C2H2-type domain-containing protein n=1 Tax=Halocaridina rubra TaxID=373956 RepID=A0AAN9A3W0_HALRR